ncbi:hypothetical protein FA15DRAFT_701570 [Coprinopsis marcescibilis]|uniref:PX domain-containing protein n=1 Tax=Coprinopsis marcescibilis TaxID=230819 RepID=A0A5C3L4Y8_COPMA|nr:hypothetical protein FA15DRAFT_701570 [Coprinopsis marcescibilis]
MSAFEFACVTQTVNPMSSDSFERTVFKPAPKRFTIELLPPTRSSNSYHHGLRICPIYKGDRSSTGSQASNNHEYDIWRRWEDCLALQDTLEKEYSRGAREKRTRLAQGKGVKMINGMYKQDMASSWESLPPGPEPNSVARDVHAYLPQLTKKGTFFRPKPALVEKRQQEFQALIESLMSDDMPALIKEIRASRAITDFFGFWRRDVEIEEKMRKKNPAPRSSITNSVFSSYFSSGSSIYSSSGSTFRTAAGSTASFITANTTSPTKTVSSGSTRTRRSSQRSTSVDTVEAPKSQQRRRPISSGSSSQSDDVPSDSSYTAASSHPRIAAEERPLQFDYDPARPQPTSAESSPISESAPRAADIYLKVAPTIGGQGPIQLRRRNKSTDNSRKSNRNWSIYGSPLVHSFDSPESMTPASEMTKDDISIRESWRSASSVGSAGTYLDSLPIRLPRDILEDRLSLSSMSTFMTSDSADAVVKRPKTPSTPSTPTTPSPRSSYNPSRASIPISLSDFEMMPSPANERLSMLDAFPRPLSYVPEVDSRPETPTQDSEYSVEPTPRSPTLRKDGKQLPSIVIPPLPQTSAIDYVAPPSPAYSVASSTFTVSTVASDVSSSTISDASTSSPSSSPQKTGNISIKASHNGSIIMLKVAQEMVYSEVRQRIYNKFVGQEGVPLSQSFLIVYSTVTGKDALTPPGSPAMIISCEDDWRDVLEIYEGPKLTLSIVSPA